MTAHTNAPRAVTDRIPPHAYFVVSAVFHYLGPSFAVLLFAAIEPLGVAWLRIASAAIVFALWRRPLRYLRAASAQERWLIVAMAATLAAMNCAFYLAIARLPLATVGAIEFLGPILLAAIGLRSQRNVVALALAVAGMWYLTDARWVAEPLGYVYAFANCALFVLYVMLGHRLAAAGGAGGIERLHAGGDGVRAADRYRAGAAGLHQSAAAGGGHRRRHFVVGHSLCMRSAGDGAPAARHLRTAAGAAARDRRVHRRPGAAADPDPRRDDRHRAGDRRRRAPPQRRAIYLGATTVW
jgi:hypothetical protein